MLLKNRLLNALPVIELLYPESRWLFLTLTLCDYNLEKVNELSSTLIHMSKSWEKFVRRREFYRITLGWIRTVRIINRTIPHFNVLLLVQPGYFGEFYLSNGQWTELWRQCAGLSYTPLTDIRTVRDCKEFVEKMKIVNPEDLIDGDSIVELSRRLSRNRFTSTGGVLRRLLRRKTGSSRIIGKSYSEVCDYPNALPVAIDGDRRVYHGRGRIYLVQNEIVIDYFHWLDK